MKKIVRKVIGISAMFIGAAAGCALDSDISVGGICLLAAVFMIGVFGGGALLSQGEYIEDIK